MSSVHKIITKIGHMETIEKLSGYSIDDAREDCLIPDNQHKGCNLDAFAEDFEHLHKVSRPSSVDSVFELKNGDLAFVEYKDALVVKSLSPKLEFAHEDGKCYETWLLKKLYDSIIMIHTDCDMRLRDCVDNNVAYIVIPYKKNKLGKAIPGATISAAMRRTQINCYTNYHPFKGLEHYLFRQILIISPQCFINTVVPRIKECE